MEIASVESTQDPQANPRSVNITNRQLLEAAPDPMVVVDSDGIIALINQQTEVLFGFARDELLGQPVEVLIPERYQGAHPAHRQTYLGNARFRPMGEQQLLFARRKDGSEFPVEISLGPVQTDEGIYVVSTIRDISDRLKLSERRFRAIFQQKHQLAGIVDLDGVLTDANERSLSLSGLKREDVIGQPFWETGWWTHDADLQAKLRHAIDAAKSGETVRFEATHPRVDGSLAVVDFSIRPVRNERGEILFLVPESQDITERKNAENELRQQQEKLETRVTERTAELAEANTQLRQSRDVAEAATATKTRFLAAASHDLRQPLQSLGLYLSVLMRRIENEDLLDVGDKMRGSLDAMGDLLDALLDISRFESGSIQAAKADFQLGDLLDRIIDDNAPHAEDKGLTLARAGDDCTVHSDPVLLGRIIENFVSNAVRYSQEGSVTIECKKRDGEVEIRVIDTGIGIAPEDVENIFEEYWQLDNPVRDRRKGLGLGLSIARQIARILGLELSVTSELGKGSSFSVRVPLGHHASKRNLEQPSTDPVAESVTQPIVLFVDDDPAITDATTMLLESEGIEVHGALDSDQALAKISDGVLPNMLITDFRLPGRTGVELIRLVRDQYREDLPAVLISGDTATIDQAAAGLSNCTVMHKPADIDQLIALIKDRVD